MIILLLFISLCGTFANPLDDNRYQIIEFSGLDVSCEKELFEDLKVPPHLRETIEIFQEDLQSGTIQLLIEPGTRDVIFQDLDDSYTAKVIVDDVDQLIRTSELLRQAGQTPKGGARFDAYMQLEEIEDYLKTITEKNPDICKLEVAGTTHDGNSIYALRMSTNVTAAALENKPVIFIEAGIHAREWISPASAVYLISELLKSQKLLSQLEWVVIPVTNPDGYKYTWETGVAVRRLPKRFWRKNRNPNVGSRCRGVDLNRNFRANWEANEGSSMNSCSSQYKGKSAFSEPETKAVEDLVMPIKDRVEAYLSVHSYSQLILYPPSSTGASYSSISVTRARALAHTVTNAIFAAQGVLYRQGITKDILYAATGSSMDWARNILTTHRSYTFELQDKGTFGFVLPAARVEKAVQDLWIGAQIIANDVLKTL